MRCLRDFFERGAHRPMAIFMLPWLLLVGLSLGWNLHQVYASRAEIARETARAFFSQILITRRWNAGHGGVYVPVGAATQPNPYLDAPRRDIRVSDDLTLTLVNPAFMTRQLGEIAREREGIRFHITSLNPIRPDNRADDWEADALRQFEQGQREIGGFVRTSRGMGYRYMAPLITERYCLDCHAEQGYREGDIRGGISIHLPYVAKIPLLVLSVSHAAIALAGSVFIFWMSGLLSRSHARLREQAYRDHLTNIPNRRFLNHHLLDAFLRAQREHAPLALILCDIDRFKDYNDSLGHQAGDACLQEVARILESHLRRDGDFCARYGGEEFVLVLPNTTLAGAAIRAETIREAILAHAIPHPKSELGIISLSLGVASIDREHSDHEALIHRADQALYRAKLAGRNRVEVEGAL